MTLLGEIAIVVTDLPLVVKNSFQFTLDFFFLKSTFSVEIKMYLLHFCS